MKPMTITELVAMRIEAKRIEDKAIAERRQIDEQLADLLKNPEKPEGSISQRLEDIGMKLTVTYKITRSADAKKLQADWEQMPESAKAAFKWKPEVSVSELRKLDGVDATVASAYITSKPGSPSIEIQAI